MEYSVYNFITCSLTREFKQTCNCLFNAYSDCIIGKSDFKSIFASFTEFREFSTACLCLSLESTPSLGLKLSIPAISSTAFTSSALPSPLLPKDKPHFYLVFNVLCVKLFVQIGFVDYCNARHFACRFYQFFIVIVKTAVIVKYRKQKSALL